MRFLPPLLTLLLLTYGFWPWITGSSRPPRTLVISGFSIFGEVMTEGIVPAFERSWAEQTGETIEAITSFAGSGTVTNQIRLGVPVEVTVLAHELDALRLAAAGIVTPAAWRALPAHGVPIQTPIVLMVRPGNPLRLTTFTDLTRPGVRIVHADPLTSGGALWGILAEFAAFQRTSPNPGEDLARMWRNVAAQAGSARGARTQFEQGFGDVLVTYEQEAVRDLDLGRFEGEIIRPPGTIMAEPVVVPIARNIKPADDALVRAFAAFLWSDTAQRIFLRYGFRPIGGVPASEEVRLPPVEAITVAALGGWAEANEQIIEREWKPRVRP